MSSSYDRAVTIFSPDGHLLQVEYAQEAVNKGAAAVGVRGDNCIVLGVEKKTMGRLQEDRTIRKICALDQHVVMAFAGLNADARVLINRAQIECQSHRLNLADPVTLEYITRYISEVKQKYTQSNGRRPFGLSCLIGGFDADGSAHLYQTNPSGTFHEYNANAIGRSAKFVLKFFEENYRAEEVNTEFGAVKLAIRALLEVAQSGQQNLDVVIMEYGKLPRMLHHNDLLKYVELIEKENEEKLEKKQQKK